MAFRDGAIEGVRVRSLVRYGNDLAWLSELYRSDEMPAGCAPQMGYVSQISPRDQRGPHEHHFQADYFCFIGPSRFRLVLWDARKVSKTLDLRMIIEGGDEDPVAVLVPPGVVHAYRNIGPHRGWVLNFPNRLYRGVDRRESPDEIRHEEDPDTLFVFPVQPEE